MESLRCHTVPPFLLLVRHLVCLLVLMILLPTPARADRWEILDGSDDNELIFHSKATLESFDGKTTKIRGWIECDIAVPGDSVSWWIEVDLRSLDTGIGLRNTHMRENHLHTEQYPTAVFRGESLKGDSSGSLTGGTEMEFVLQGDFSLHGVTQKREIPVRVRLQADGSLLVEAEFGVSLEDHEIPRPGFLMMKLADVQQVRLRFRAQPQPDETP